MTLLKVMRDMEFGVTVDGFHLAFRDRVAEANGYLRKGAEATFARAIPNKFARPKLSRSNAIQSAWREAPILLGRSISPKDGTDNPEELEPSASLAAWRADQRSVTCEPSTKL